MPVRAIAAHLDVSQSSVSVWVRDVKLLPRHKEANRKRAGALRGEKWRERFRAQRREYQHEGREQARLGDPLHIAGCMIYWAEGAKNRNTLKLANSDPSMMVLFVRFLRECFGYSENDLTFSLNVYTTNGQTIEEIEAYWIDLLGLSPECARKHVLNHFPTSSSGTRPNKLPYGVCSITAKRSTRAVQHIFGAIQEYSGIDQPQWLDGPPIKPPAPKRSN
jgi:hypothetical protein